MIDLIWLIMMNNGWLLVVWNHGILNAFPIILGMENHPN